jgi:hypothetical protein
MGSRSRAPALAAPILGMAAAVAVFPGAASARPARTVALPIIRVRSGDWERRPSFRDVQDLTPPEALKHRIDGRATLDCRVDDKGYLTGCRAEQPDLRALDFAGAALKLAPYFKLPPRLADGRKVAGGLVRIAIYFGPPAR